MDRKQFRMKSTSAFPRTNARVSRLVPSPMNRLVVPLRSPSRTLREKARFATSDLAAGSRLRKSSYERVGGRRGRMPKKANPFRRHGRPSYLQWFYLSLSLSFFLLLRGGSPKIPPVRKPTVKESQDLVAGCERRE